jgi:acyl carrier protein
MTRDKIETKVKVILGRILGVPTSDINEDDKLIDTLGADSLDTLEIIIELEKEFGISIPDEDCNKFGWECEVKQIINDIAVKLPETRMTS